MAMLLSVPPAIRWRMLRRVAAVSLACAVSLAQPRSARAASPSHEHDQAPDEDQPPSSVDVSVEELGPVTWADARVDVSLSKQFGFFPQAALLRVGPISEGDQTAWRPHFGGGVTYRPDDSWTFELSGTYAPTSYNIESIGGLFDVEKEIGADWDRDKPPAIELDLELGVNHFRWEDGQGPAGADVFQSFVELKPLFRVTSRLELTPRAMYFLYDKQLTQAFGDRLGSVMVLAEVGAFAPVRALGGARAAYRVLDWISPFVQVDEILYAYDSGDATQLLAGATFKIGKGAMVMLGGGALLNRNSGSLIPAAEANKSLPVGITEVTVDL
jgi:hypothetical protein